MDLVLYHDTDMKILWGNRRALDSAGMEPEGLAARDCWEIWHRRTEACPGCPVVLALATGEPQEAEMRGSDDRHWYIRGFPVKDDDGRVKGVVEFCLDTTERKRMAEEIEILNTNLASHAIELEIANHELEAANRELEAFNYTVSHDLHSPLTGISGYCELLLESFSTSLGETGTGYLQQIGSAARQMDQLISTLLNFSRISRCTMTREEVDLTSTAKYLACQLKMTKPDRRVTFAVAEGIKTQGDTKLLGVVMENLIGNAWKYTGKREEAFIEFGMAKHDGTPTYFVRDNGIGFDMAHADRLFRPFERLPGTTDIAGHGIGLATVQRIIQRHGGKVWAEGEPGKGATIYFTL